MIWTMAQDDFNETDYIKHALLGVLIDGLIARSVAEERGLVVIESDAGKGKRQALPLATLAGAQADVRCYQDDTPMVAARKLETARRSGLRYELHLHEGNLECRKDLKLFMNNYAGLHHATDMIHVSDALFEESMLGYHSLARNTDHNFVLFMDPSDQVALKHYSDSMISDISHWLKKGRTDVMLYMTQLTRRPPYDALHGERLAALQNALGRRAVDFFHRMRGGAMESLDHFMITVEDKALENRLIDTHVDAFGQLFPDRRYAANITGQVMTTEYGGFHRL